MLNAFCVSSAISALNTVELTGHTFVFPEWLRFLFALAIIIAIIRIPVVLLGLDKKDGD